MQDLFDRFFRNMQDDVESLMNENIDFGTSPVQAFTRIATDKLADAYETANVIIAYDERNLGKVGQHMINAYAISENYETLDLFISIHNNGNTPTKLNKSDIDTAAKRIFNFLIKVITKGYADELDPASQIYQLAQSLMRSNLFKEFLVRINFFILTNNYYDGKIPNMEVLGSDIGWIDNEISTYYRVIDLKYLYNISEVQNVPIEINLESRDLEVPCIKANSNISSYQSYLAILPGTLVAKLYDEYGQRLLEQNVRSFLQFTGKINKGIRNTINKEPEMFFAYNNGITGTAEEIVIEKGTNGNMIITYIKGLQIVNGGQTTASLFHTWRKDRADLTNIFVPMKLNVIKNIVEYPRIIEKIAEYANTQNKVSFSDLSANNPFYIELEKLSRSIVAPHVAGQSVQTHWFFERSRAQYKNQRAKEGNTLSRLKSFDLRNPKSQLFTKEELAKYINTFSLIEKSRDGKNVLLVGPNTVVQGNQKNHDVFIKYNLPTSMPDSIWFEDLIAKAILFRTAEKLYGRAPNAIGDMRYITVPYTLAYLNHYLRNTPINWFKIWQQQDISEPFQSVIKDMLYSIETLIKEKSPGSLYAQFAKDAACWNVVKQSAIAPDISQFEHDLIDPQQSIVRTAKVKEVIDATLNEILNSNVQNTRIETWNKILIWNDSTELLNHSQILAINELLNLNKLNYSTLNDILDLVSKNSPDLLSTEYESEENSAKTAQDRASKMIDWIKSKKHSVPKEYYSFLKQVRDLNYVDSVEVRTKLSVLENWLAEYNYPN